MQYLLIFSFCCDNFLLGDPVLLVQRVTLPWIGCGLTEEVAGTWLINQLLQAHLEVFGRDAVACAVLWCKLLYVELMNTEWISNWRETCPCNKDE